MELHLHVHIHDRREPVPSNAPVLSAIAEFREKMMTTARELKDVLDAINATTNEMATVVDEVIAADQAEDDAFRAEIQALKDQLAAGTPVSQEQLDALGSEASTTAARLAAVRDTLKATGAVENPAPPLPPVDLNAEV